MINKRKVILGVKTFLSFLTFVVCICICSVPASATLVMDIDSNTVDVDVVVIITISSDTGNQNSPYDYGVYLDPVEVGGAPYGPGNDDAQLDNATMLVAAGPSATVVRQVGYEYGDEYQAKKSGGDKPDIGDWSTVEFKGLVAGTYKVYLYDYDLNGGDYLNQGTAVDTQTITVIPEPAMIGLLGVGGMFLLGRRRRT